MPTLHPVLPKKAAELPQPVGLGECHPFDDPDWGPMLMLKDWHGDGSWLFRHNGYDWVSARRASEDDLRALGMDHWLERCD